MLKQLQERCKAEELFIHIDEIKNTSRKKERIQALHSVTKTGMVQLNKNHKLLLEQLCLFPKAPHDDGPDALQMAVIAAQDRGKVEVMIVESKDDSWIYDYERNFGWNLHF
jgi:predicted phage terminase large subunit-like protein